MKIWHQEYYVSNIRYWGRQSFLRSCWNGDTLHPKGVGDIVGVVVGFVDGGGFVASDGFVVGSADITDFVGFAGVGVLV